MGPWEVVREEARRLRGEAVRLAWDEGTEAVVTAALSILGLTIDEPGDRNAATVDADARLSPTSPRIQVSAVSDRPAWLENVAHEMGHRRLHVDPELDDGRGGSLATDDVPPDGWVPVAGYSDRQLKEVQARLFADEFLCPVDALRIRLVAGETPRGVALALGIPEALVLRQATESLVRPSGVGDRATASSIPTRSTKAVDRFDAEQAEAIAWSDGPLLVVGAAGSGKTTALAGRIRRLLGQGERTTSLLVIVATRRAADDLLSILAPVHAMVAGELWIGTIEDLAHEVLVRWPGSVDRTSSVRILDRVGALRLLADAMERDGAGRTGPARLAGTMRAIDARRASNLGPTTRASRAAVVDPDQEAYADMLAADDAVDTGGLVQTAIEVLRRDPDARAVLGERFSHFLVDDLQRLPDVAIPLLGMLVPPGGNLWATGDPRQAIDRFRGRSGQSVDLFNDTFRPGIRFLTHNHRSTPAISSAVAALYGHPGAIRRNGGPTFTIVASPEEEAEAVAARARRLERDGTAWGSQAVVAWSHATLSRVASAMRRRGIPVLHLGDVGRRRDVGDALALALFAHDGHDASFARTARMAPYHLLDATIEHHRRMAARRGSPIRDVLLGGERPQGIEADEEGRLDRLVRDVEALRGGPLHPGLATWAFSLDGRLATTLRRPDDPANRETLTAFHHLLLTCAEHHALGGRDAAGLKARVGRMASLDQYGRFHAGSSLGADLDAVQLLTIHAARGREFEAVHVAGVREAEPRDGRAPHTDAEGVLRVAFSRAKSQLHVTLPVTFDGRPCRPPAILADLIG